MNNYPTYATTFFLLKGNNIAQLPPYVARLREEIENVSPCVQEVCAQLNPTGGSIVNGVAADLFEEHAKALSLYARCVRALHTKGHDDGTKVERLPVPIPVGSDT